MTENKSAGATVPHAENGEGNILTMAILAATSKSQLHRENQKLEAEVASLKGELAKTSAAVPVSAHAAPVPVPAPGINPAPAAVPAVKGAHSAGREALEAALAVEQDPRRRFELAAKLNEAAAPFGGLDRAGIEAALAVEQDPRRRFELASALRVAEESLA